ncbi:unnamed protein product [Arabidopsis thaliana]|uniref:Uncharacterized protein n=1 Tax=Arabidopsis thaliana TaxID=3702 RepID=A0A5S9XMI2_ARATH|nr:unnamed protein product [Arabidopsis thaliana]
MGFFNSGSTMFVDKSIKKIKALQKDIVKLNNSIEGVATSEEYWLDQAATSLAVSRKYGGIYEPCTTTTTTSFFFPTFCSNYL